MANQRSKASNNRYSNADSLDYAFNQQAGAFKMVGPILGKLSILGALNVAKAVDAGALVAVYNNSGSTAFVKTGPSVAVLAPTGGSDGICVPPNSYIMIAMTSDNYIISNLATTFGYLVNDDLLFNPNSGSNQ